MNGGRTFSEMLAEIEALRVENERLREALEKIVEANQAIEPFHAIQTIARAALKGGDGE
jgi:regulator of replication initiation timing